MKILIPFDPIIYDFEQREDTNLNKYIWKFYEHGLRGAISDWLTSSNSLSYGGFSRLSSGNDSHLADHLVLSYDTWVENNQPIYGMSSYEYGRNVGRLEIIGQLLEESLNKFVYRYFKKDLSILRIKSCRWVTLTAVIIEVDL